MGVAERERQTDRRTEEDRKQDKTERTVPSAIHMSPTQKLKTSHVTNPNCVKQCSADVVSSFEAFKCDLADDGFAED